MVTCIASKQHIQQPLPAHLLHQMRQPWNQVMCQYIERSHISQHHNGEHQEVDGPAVGNESRYAGLKAQDHFWKTSQALYMLKVVFALKEHCVFWQAWKSISLVRSPGQELASVKSKGNEALYMKGGYSHGGQPNSSIHKKREHLSSRCAVLKRCRVFHTRHVLQKLVQSSWR